MAKKKGGSKKRQRKHVVSGGLRHRARANQEILCLKIKVRRWERYQTDDQKVQAASESQNTRRRLNGWDTSSLKRRIQQLESYAKRPALQP